MKTTHQSIKVRLTFVTIASTLLITLTLVAVSLYLLHQSARRSLLQSVEFNLHLATELMQTDIQHLDRLRIGASVHTQTIDFLTAEDYARPGTLLHARLTEDMAGNLAVRYLRRLIITDVEQSRRVQVGIFVDRIPVMPHVLHMLGDFEAATTPGWKGIAYDPFSIAGVEPVFYMMSPIRYGRGAETIGYIYIALSTNLILAPLAGYPLLEQGSLFLTINGENFPITGNRFTDIPVSFYNARPSGDIPLNITTEIFTFVNGGRYTAVSSPLGNTGLVLTQSFPTGLFFDEVLLVGRILLFIFVGVLILGYIIARSVNQMAKETENLMESRIEDEKKKHELEYKMLQNQINPHFLYNTLNSIKWMASIQNATGIVEMTVSLSRLLMSVAKTNKALVPLSRELSLLEDYFVISRYRFGGSITTQIDVAEEFLDSPVPIFTLQPLAENAIFHGIEASNRAGTVMVRGQRAGDNFLEIIVQDNGVGMDEDTISKLFEEEDDNQGMFSKVGIRNVHARLQYEFGPEYGIRIESQPGEFTRVIVSIPHVGKEDVYD
ncbi:MAG: sensor histidine kinase [Defluviitaleaceae bacterium]|nr:sensor histidine kinase [Defluviitaleaceae bacterium]